MTPPPPPLSGCRCLGFLDGRWFAWVVIPVLMWSIVGAEGLVPAGFFGGSVGSCPGGGVVLGVGFLAGRRVVFRPFSFLYFGFLAALFFLTLIYATSFYRGLLVEGVGIPPEAFGLVLFLSLFGSAVNIPVTSIESRGPVVVEREVRLFWVTWRIPRVVMGVRRTMVAVNLGGAVVPVLISAYLLLVSIPGKSPDVLASYVRAGVVLVVVSLSTFRSSRLVRGLGIATPAFGPPLMTVLAVLTVDLFSPLSCPTQVAYVGGSLGALIGADLLNWGRLPELGAPVVSLGGAGTFDGIYVTGLVSVLLVLLLI